MNRKDLRRLANERRRDAKRLLDAGSYPGAYYLSGLVVECALKAVIASFTKRDDFPDKNHARDCFEHDPNKLVKVAGLGDDLKAEIDANPTFAANWSIVAQWSIEDRYDHQITEADANELYSAVSSRTNGVLNWLRQHW